MIYCGRGSNARVINRSYRDIGEYSDRREEAPEALGRRVSQSTFVENVFCKILFSVESNHRLLKARNINDLEVWPARYAGSSERVDSPVAVVIAGPGSKLHVSL